jgi:hypothetical protein
MRIALHYEFSECECLAPGGGVVQIPPGIWPVAGRDAVFALVGGTLLALDASAFEQLKREGKARPLS